MRLSLPAPASLTLLLGLCAAAQAQPTVTQMVLAATGGEVTSPSGQATLAIPPGALAADTEVTITELPPEDGPAVGPVYDLQPDGLQLAQPATLTIRYAPTDVPEGYRPEDVAIMQVLPRPEPDAQAGLGAVMRGMATPPYQNLETTVDAAAGTVTAQLAHLSRYAARAYSTFDTSEWPTGQLLGSFDFGQAFSLNRGVELAEAHYGLPGWLSVQVVVPMGQDGWGTALASLWKTFRAVPEEPATEPPWFQPCDIQVNLRHAGITGPDTNTYDAGFVVWFAAADDQGHLSAGEYVAAAGPDRPDPFDGWAPAAGPLAGIAAMLPGIYSQSFSRRPREPAQWVLPEYEPQQGAVRFRNAALRNGQFYAVGVSLFATIKGRPARGERPPEGGAVEFVQDGFRVTGIHITESGHPAPLEVVVPEP